MSRRDRSCGWGSPGRWHSSGGKTGRRAALTGIAAVALDSVVVNLVGKMWFRRRRPNPAEAGVPERRRVQMPTSHSFPSGHAASGFAFTEAVGGVAPGVAMPLRLLATVVGYSRVHTGPHYPGGVIAGADRLLDRRGLGLGARWIQNRRRS
jgi:membrane-associated phospholipid phosphatase